MGNKTKARKNKFLMLALAGVVALAFVFYFLVLNNKVSNSLDKQQNQLIPYESTSLKFSILFSGKFVLKENELSVELDSSFGKILVTRNFTNFSNLSNYINNFDSRRKLVESGRKNLLINNYPALSRIVQFPDEKISQKSYYIYSNNAVYIFSTTSEALYPDLDQIAKSFRYTP